MAKDTRMGMPGGGTGSGSTGAMRGKKTSNLSLNTKIAKKSGRTTGEIKGILRASKPGKTTGLAKGKNKDFAKNTPKLQRKYDNLRSGSNTLSPSSLAKFPKQTKPVPVKPRGGMRGGGLGGLNKANR